jgi:nitrate reductase gamma subunit
MPFEGERPYGRSQYEALGWWQKPRQKNRIKEACYIAKEIFFFRQVFKRNKNLWYFGYSLHLGLYLYFIWLLLLTVGAISVPGGFAGPAESHGPFNRMLDCLTLGTGIASFVLGILGAIGLFVKRMTEEDLKLYTQALDYFNLLFIAAIFVSGLWSWWSANRMFFVARHYLWSLLTLSRVTKMDTATALHILLASAFVAYMPFTTMIHYLAKYFSFHKVRWDDEPNLRGSGVEKKVQQVLSEKVGWSAAHISPGGTWKDLTQLEKENSKRSAR